MEGKKKEFNDLMDGALETFIKNVSSFNESLPLILIALSAFHHKNVQIAGKFISDNKIKKTKKNGSLFIKLSGKNAGRFEVIQKRLDGTGIPLLMVPQSFVISLVAQFDSFVSKIIKAMFLIKPELLKIDKDNLTYEKIFDFSSIDQVRDYLVSNKIDEVLRGSHVELFEWLQRYLNFDIISKIDIFPDFIEICERRNLFVHTDGVVSEQYLRACQKSGNKKITLKIGEKVEASSEYFDRACSTTLEMGILVSQIIRRKLLPSDILPSDLNLNQVCYDLIKDKKYKLTHKLLDFPLSEIGNHANKEIEMMININKILTYKLEGNDKKVSEKVLGIDWSALHPRFGLARDVLLNKYMEASKTMLLLGKDEIVNESAYDSWPLFDNFRNTDVFRRTYRKIFGKDFIKFNNPKSLLEEITKPKSSHKNKNHGTTNNGKGKNLLSAAKVTEEVK